MKRRTIHIILVGIALVSLLGLALANPDPLVREELCQVWCPRTSSSDFWTSIGFGLSVGSISSVMFYLLLVALPDAERHRQLKRSLLRRYEEFRRESITQLLYASGASTISTEEINALMEPLNFKEYFYSEMWSAAANAYNYDEERRFLESTVLAVHRFKFEVDYVLVQSKIDDERVFERLKGLSTQLEEMTHAKPEYDSIKSLFRDLWSIHTGWSFLDGDYGRDRIRELLMAV